MAGYTYTIGSGGVGSYTVSNGQTLEVQNGGESSASIVLSGGPKLSTPTEAVSWTF